MIVSSSLLFIIFHSFVFTYAAPADSLILSSKTNQDTSHDLKSSRTNIDGISGGISYRREFPKNDRNLIPKNLILILRKNSQHFLKMIRINFS